MSRLTDDVKDVFRDRTFLGKAVKIALPVAIQGMLNTITNMVDTMMIGSMGATAIAAVGLANKVFFVFALLVFGVSSGSGILAAQFWGKGDARGVRKVLGLALVIALISSALFVIPAVFCPQFVMSIFTTSTGSIAIGAEYLRIAALTYPLIAVSNVYVAMLRATNRVKFPVATSCVAIIINVILNYMLIFGKFGAPQLGVVGAALATLAARIAEVVLILSYVNLKKTPLAGRFRELFAFEKIFVIQFFKTASPVIANEFVWGLGVTMYSLAYGRMGDEAVAAITIASTIQDIVNVLFQGLSAATAVILGHEMGGGRLKTAEKYAKNFLILQFIVTLVGASFCYATRWQVISLYSITEAVAFDVSRCLTVYALYMPFKMFNYINVVGILRSGGDTIVCFLIDTSGVWLIGIPMAFVGGLVLKQPIYVVYAMVMAEEAYKAVIGYLRYRQKKWLRNLTVNLNT